MEDYDFDVAILGAGTAGMSAYREATKYTDRVALIDGGPLGTTCARVGCMPSKLLIAAADAKHAAGNAEIFGISTNQAEVYGRAVMQRVRNERDRFVGFVHDAVDGFDKGEIIREFATFRDDHTLQLTSGRLLTARAIIIATGSRPNIPPMLEAAGDRLIVNDDVFDWDGLPNSAAVFGAGVIGLELSQALHRLDVRVELFGRDNFVGPLTDPDIRAYAARTFADEFPAHWHADTRIERDGDQVIVYRADETGEVSARFDYVLAATGRKANVDRIGLENTSLVRDARGVPLYDPLSLRAGDSHIFVAGDAVGDLPLLHEAADEGRLAGENAARLPDAYRRARRVPLGIVFSNPQIAMAGRSHGNLVAAGVPFETGTVSFEDQGRARVMGINKGCLHVYAEKGTGQVLGAEMIGPAAEHLGHLLAWSITDGITVSQALERPFYHPVIEEGLRTALRDVNSKLGFGPNPPLRCIDCGPGA
ncbi:dihydrolipoyl dehydrogenase [uncultured Tateyamaria sp.]|uniref:dihydrolipoyl dehydrogenase n=1 Tax=uncultured Tateyamaria sp. TaxID=455651 RepID=UPI00261502C8|nr:dihydrolipoyl dehydrogenase [uncultured Tateyamaria sp.]